MQIKFNKDGTATVSFQYDNGAQLKALTDEQLKDFHGELFTECSNILDQYEAEAA